MSQLIIPEAKAISRQVIPSNNLDEKVDIQYRNQTIQFIVRYCSVPIILFSTILTYYYFVHVYIGHKVLGFMPTEMAAFAAASIVLAFGLMFFELNYPLEKFEESAHQTKTDVFFNIGTGLLLVFFHPIIIKVPVMFEPISIGAWPFLIQFVIGWAFHDLLLYGWHRLLHESGSAFLWKLHEPHHSPDRLNFMAGGRSHIFEILFVVVALCITKVLFGLSNEVMIWVLMCPVISGAVHHTNVDFRLGWFNYVFPGPEMHRVHHDKDLHEALNYSTSFPFWDVLFGSAKPLRKANETPFGLDYHDDKTETYIEVFFRPFKELRRSK